MLSGPLPTFAVTLSLLDVQNNSELVGPFMSALSTTCGTNLCTAATTLQACFPPSVQVMSLTVALTYALVFQHMFSAPSCYNDADDGST
ncbi:Hypothetical protein, putative [Bodo saltans]|uniref:Uncharacterized protein n=1 Tax=Bodo saltans TaxID=75058 RepID=A0A0S4IIK6_BODSA|nr:Hypothetical protein, putative [Bodo saltans]|eukprot:CUE72220.1 Hypothetical protein, putative [Bodo saltans]